jgi:hypothetical protein
MSAVKPPKTGDELLEMYYLDIRSHLLEAAAALDRIERAGGSLQAPRPARLLEAAKIALGPGPDRATRMQEFLSEK